MVFGWELFRKKSKKSGGARTGRKRGCIFPIFRDFPIGQEARRDGVSRFFDFFLMRHRSYIHRCTRVHPVQTGISTPKKLVIPECCERTGVYTSDVYTGVHRRTGESGCRLTLGRSRDRPKGRRPPAGRPSGCRRRDSLCRRRLRAMDRHGPRRTSGSPSGPAYPSGRRNPAGAHGSLQDAQNGSGWTGDPSAWQVMVRGHRGPRNGSAGPVRARLRHGLLELRGLEEHGVRHARADGDSSACLPDSAGAAKRTALPPAGFQDALGRPTSGAGASSGARTGTPAILWLAPSRRGRRFSACRPDSASVLKRTAPASASMPCGPSPPPPHGWTPRPRTAGRHADADGCAGDEDDSLCWKADAGHGSGAHGASMPVDVVPA